MHKGEDGKGALGGCHTLPHIATWRGGRGERRVGVGTW